MDKKYVYFSKAPEEIMGFLDILSKGIVSLIELWISLKFLNAFLRVITMEGEYGFWGRAVLLMISIVGLVSVRVCIILSTCRSVIFLKKDALKEEGNENKVALYKGLIGVLGFASALIIANPGTLIQLQLSLGGLNFGDYFQELLPAIIMLGIAGWLDSKAETLVVQEEENKDEQVKFTYFDELLAAVGGLMEYMGKRAGESEGNRPKRDYVPQAPTNNHAPYEKNKEIEENNTAPLADSPNKENEKENKCPKCKKEIQDDWNICPYCQTVIKKSGKSGHSAMLPSNNKLAAKQGQDGLMTISFLKFIVLSLVTCGIYSIYAIYKFSKTVNVLCEGDGQKSRNYFVVVLLGMLTCGIYYFYWIYKQAQRMHDIAPKYKCEIKTTGTKMLLWSTFGSLIFAGPLVVWYSMLKNMNQLAEQYNQKLVDDNFQINTAKKDIKKPAVIIAAFYIVLILFFHNLITLLAGFLFSEPSYNSDFYDEYESYSSDEGSSLGDEINYEYVTVEQLERNPQNFIGKPIIVESSFTLISDQTVILTPNVCIEINYKKPAHDANGMEIGNVLSGDRGYVKGVYDQYINSLGSVQPMINAEEVVIMPEDEDISFSDIYEESYGSDTLLGTYQGENGESITIYSYDGYTEMGDQCVAKVEGTHADGQVWTGCITNTEDDPIQVLSFGGKVVAWLYPDSDGIAFEWRHNAGNHEWYTRIE